MSNFKVGDIVRVTNTMSKYCGVVGPITMLGSIGFGWWIAFGHENIYVPVGVELVKAA